jgi:hypothetical protein
MTHWECSIYNYLSIKTILCSGMSYFSHYGFRSRSGYVYSIQNYAIKFVSDLWQVGGFLRVLRVSSTNKTDRHDITEILLKVALNTITLTWNLSKLNLIGDNFCVRNRQVSCLFRLN